MNPSNDFTGQVRAKQEEQARRQQETSRYDGILSATQGSGKDTRDAINDLIMATLVSKNPRLVDVAENLASLLQGIAEASKAFGGSNLTALPEIHTQLVSALRDLPTAISDSNTTPDLVPYLQDLNESVRSLEVSPNVSVSAPAFDVKPLERLIGRIEKALKDQPASEGFDTSKIEEAVNAVETSIRDLIAKPIPVPVAPLPFKNTANEGVQVVLNAGSVPVSGTLTATPEKASTATLANVATSTASATLLSSNSSRKKAVIVNDSAVNMYVKYGTTASATSFSYLLQPYDILEESTYTGRVDGILASGSGNARTSEL